MADRSDKSQDLAHLNERHREAFLLALAGALLHNLGKVSYKFFEKIIDGENGFLYQHILGLLDNDARSDIRDQILYKKESKKGSKLKKWSRWELLGGVTAELLQPDTKSALINNKFSLPWPFNDREYRLGDLIEYLGQGEPWYRLPDESYNIQKIFNNGSLLTHLMNRAHGAAAGGEKEGLDKTKTNQEEKENLWQATPFGWERKIKDCSPGSTGIPEIDELRLEIEEIIQKYLLHRAVPFPFANFAQDLAPLLEQAIADTNRPINDVSVWDIGHTGAAFLLAFAVGLVHRNESISHHFLDDKNKSGDNLKWRVLRIGIDGLAYLKQASQMTDVRVRRDLLQGSLDRVRRELEEVPLALQVYRDENGSAFVFPDVPSDSVLYKKTRELIFTSFEKTDVLPAITLSDSLPSLPLRNEKDRDETIVRKNIEKIIRFLNQVPSVLEYNINRLETAWNIPKVMREICTACGLRPQGYGASEIPDYAGNASYYRDKAASRNICCLCMDRRRGIAENWATNGLNKPTVWIDEVTDDNSRVALITGSFDLDLFLKNQFYPSAEGVVRSQSFARLRRVWEVTEQFWRDIANNIEKDLRCQQKRLEISGKIHWPSKDGMNILGNFHAYELVLAGSIKMNVVWDPAHNHGQGRFISADNLENIKKQLLESSIVEFLKEKTIIIEQPGGYGSKAKKEARIEIETVSEIPGSEYSPTIAILREPQHFMVLVPAATAWDIARYIKEKYEREMGKVQNRLPLHLGLVYAHHRTPVRAIIDAGTRMLKQKGISSNKWNVQKNEKVGTDKNLPKNQLFLKLDNCQFDESRALTLFNRVSNKTITWYVPMRMGDGVTPDCWYPYVFLTSNDDRAVKESPTHEKSTQNGNENKMVHVEKLATGDSISFSPSTLDWTWLDTSARRFEIAYADTGCRLDPEKRHRPYLLDEMECIISMWKTLSRHLHTNQIYGLHTTIENKRREWLQDSEPDSMETFRLFCLDCLINLEWRENKTPWQRAPDADAWFKQWTGYAASGLLADTIELYMQVLKKRPETEDKEHSDEH